MQILSAGLLVSVFSRGSLATQCSVADAENLGNGNISKAGMQACLGTSVDVSKLESCLKSSGVSLSSECVNCLFTVTSAAQICGSTCATDPQGAPCKDCVAHVSINALKCFGSDLTGFTHSGQSGITTKAALVPHFAAATGIIAIALLS